MFLRHRLGSRSPVTLAAVLAAALAVGLCAATGGQQASAQIYTVCPAGTYSAYAGGPCMTYTTTSTTTAYIPGYVYCSYTGGYLPPGQYCGPAATSTTYIPGYVYCSYTGGYLPPSSYCSPTATTTAYVPGYVYCSYTSSYLPPSQYCGPSSSYVTCPTYPSGSYCCYAGYSVSAYCPPTSIGVSPTAGAITVTYPAGWNIISLPLGSILTGPSGPLYTLQGGIGGIGGYTTATISTLQTGAGIGYWAYFPTTTTVSLVSTGTTAGSVSVPSVPGAWVMIGNPFTYPATVSGASVVLTYDPVNGYVQTTQLNPGQGAFALSYGGSITITSTGAPYGPGVPPPPPPPY